MRPLTVLKSGVDTSNARVPKGYRIHYAWSAKSIARVKSNFLELAYYVFQNAFTYKWKVS